MAQTTSVLWRELFNAGARREYAFDINGVWYGEEAELSHRVDSGLYEEFGIGGAASAKLSLELLAEEIPRGAAIKRYARLKREGQVSEWLPAGVFYINKRSEDGGHWQIEAFDALRKAEAVWEPAQSLAFPMTMPNAVKELARLMGCEVDPRTSLNGAYTIDYPANGYTVRDVLQFIAAAHGGNWVMSGAGKLRLVPLRSGGTAFQVGMDLTGFKDNGVKAAVSRVTLTVDEERVLTAGDDTGLELKASCPYATQAMAKAVLAAVGGYAYRMYTAEAVNLDPAAEPGDSVSVGGITSVLARMEDDGSGYPTISAPGAAELEEEFPAAGPLTREVQRTLAEARSSITKTAEEIRLEVEGVDGRVSSLTQTVGSFEQRITSAEGNVSSLSQTVEGFSAQLSSATGELQAQLDLKVGKDENDQIVSMLNASADKIVLSGKRFVLDAENCKIDENGNLTVKNGNFTGRITATEGYIGGSSGWTIAATAIYKGLSSLNGTANGVYIGTDGIALGGGKFKVTSAGALTATSGTVGGWTISDTKIYGGDSEGYAVLAYPREDNTYVFAVGGKTSQGPFNDWPFRVSKTGRLYAKDAIIEDILYLFDAGMNNSEIAAFGAVKGGVATKSWLYFGDGTYHIRTNGRAHLNGAYFGSDESYYFSYEGNVVCNNLTISEDGHLYIRRSYRGGVRQDEPLRLYAYDANGSALVMQAGGLTIVGGGESGTNLYNALIAAGTNAGTEQLHLAADSTIYLHTNCNTIAKRVTLTIGTDGTITTPGGLSVAGAAAFTGNATFSGSVKAAKFIQVGTVTITPEAANTPTSAEVKFPTAFPGVPKVFVTANTSVPGTAVTGVAANNVSATGCTIWLTRTNVTATGVWWVAVYT